MKADNYYFQTIIWFHQTLQEMKVFSPLRTEIEFVEVNQQIIQENITYFQENPKMQNLFKHWFINLHEKNYSIIKIMDNSESYQSIQMNFLNQSQKLFLESIIYNFRGFIVQYVKDELNDTFLPNLVLCKDPIHQDRTLSQSSCINYRPKITLTVYIIPQTTKSYECLKIIQTCNIYKSVNIANSITFKHIKKDDIKFLQEVSTDYIALQQILINLYQFNSIISWENPEQIEILYSFLSQNQKYEEIKQEYRSSIEFFTEPILKDKADILNTLFQGQGYLTFNNSNDRKTKLELIIIFPQLKENIIIVRLNGKILAYSEIYENLNQCFKKIQRNNCLYIIQIDGNQELQILFQEFFEFLQTQTDKIKKPRFQQVDQSIKDQILINQSANLFINIQRKCNVTLEHLKDEQWNFLKQNLQKLMISSYFIDQV